MNQKNFQAFVGHYNRILSRIRTWLSHKKSSSMSESKKGPEICDVISAKCFSVCEINPMITTIMITRNTCIAEPRETWGKRPLKC